MSYNSEFEEMDCTFSYDDDFDASFGDEDFDDFDSYEEDDEALDEFDDDSDLYYDDVFKEEEDIDEPYDDVEPEDGYTFHSSSSDDIFREDEF